MSVSASSSLDGSQSCICGPVTEERKDFETFPLLFSHLQRGVENNLNYFSRYCHKSVYRRFYEAFQRVREVIDPLEKMAVYIAQRVSIFDYSPQAKGNGYRSLLRLLQHCMRAVTELTYYCQSHRDRFYFRVHHYCLEIEAHADLFTRTKDLLNYAITCMNESQEGMLFPDSIDSTVMIEAEMMDRECFYGRTLGFQYRQGLRQFLTTVCVAMASFAEGYHRHKSNPFACMTTSVLHSGKYTVNPELRAKMIVKLTTQKANMEFCKAFWSLTEGFGLQHFPLFICPAMKVNTLFHIPAEALEIFSEQGESVHVAPPCSWSGLAPVQVRLLSYEWREGQIKESNGNHSSSSKVKPKSKGLIFHIHGGGFVSQSSKSHEMYLRVWAREVNVPILSVDYSHAPEAPFPRALEECFFAYSWALMNAEKLGTTAQYVCVAGDSAGGNLSVAVCMRAAEYGIRRPDSLLAAYSPFNVQYIPSPSRLLSLLDPLLPTGILSACLGAYAGMGKSPFEECMKTPSNSRLIKKSSSMPVDINKTRPQSFLDKFKRESRSPRSCTTSPVREEGGESFDSFYSCPSSPLHSDTALTPTSASKDGLRSESFNSKISSKRSDAYLVNGNHAEDVENYSKDNQLPEGCPAINIEDSNEVSLQKDENELTEKDISEACHGVDDMNLDETNATILLPTQDSLNPVDTNTNEDEEPVNQVVKSRSMSQISLPIVKNPYMSPLLAPDEMLATLPPMDIVACTLDPLLDDSIEFARRLRSLGKEVELYILEDLPHGFLNFNLICQEAKDGCDLCIACMKRTMLGKRNNTNDKAPVY